MKTLKNDEEGHIFKIEFDPFPSKVDFLWKHIENEIFEKVHNSMDNSKKDFVKLRRKIISKQDSANLVCYVL